MFTMLYNYQNAYSAYRLLFIHHIVLFQYVRNIRLLKNDFAPNLNEGQNFIVPVLL